MSTKDILIIKNLADFEKKRSIEIPVVMTSI